MSLTRALLDEVSTSMRRVAIRSEPALIQLRFDLDRVPTEDDLVDGSGVGGEVIADFNDFDIAEEFHFTAGPLAPLPDWEVVFRRREDGEPGSFACPEMDA